MSQASADRLSVYEIVTERILALLEQGTIPWRKPWSETNGPVAALNIRGTIYRGANRALLPALGHESPVWLTYKQAREYGGHVRTGEKSTPIVFWLFDDKRPGEADPDPEATTRHTRVMFRYYPGFNLDQTEDVSVPPATLAKLADRPEPEPIAAAEAIVAGYKGAPVVYHYGNRAFYDPAGDRVVTPGQETFTTPEHYYSTLFHELGHSTGHESRLARDIKNVFGDHLYSQEELVAELTASFLAAEAGIDAPTLTNSAAYIASWMRALQNDPRLFTVAAGRAQKAADHILGVPIAHA